MKLVIQRVARAGVVIGDETVASIRTGYLVLLGIGRGDSREMAEHFLSKLLRLRIFPDEAGKTNRSISDVGGEILIVSQFTLYADCRKGNRPGFTDAAEPQEARALYDYFVSRCQEEYGSVQAGRFGAEMKVELVNDGPFTLVWDSRDWGL